MICFCRCSDLATEIRDRAAAEVSLLSGGHWLKRTADQLAYYQGQSDAMQVGLYVLYLWTGVYLYYFISQLL